MFEMIGLIKTCFDLRIRQAGANFLIAFEVIDQLAAFIPGFHRIALNQTIAVLTRYTGLGQGQKQTLGIMDAALGIEVFLTAISMDD